MEYVPMTLAELIETLIDQAREINPDWEPGDPLENDPEIVVAYQPTWPMETQITNVVMVDPTADELDELQQALYELEPDEDREGIQDTIQDLEANAKPKSIVIGTAWDNEYLRSGGASALGWS